MATLQDFEIDLRQLIRIRDRFLAIANINVWNRLNAAVRQPVGAWKV